MYKIYEFKDSDAYDFSRHVGIETNEHAGELFFKTCPYCKPKATRGNTKTFSINLTTGQFKCLRASCGVSGNMITLSKDFDFSLGNEVDEYYRPSRQFRKIPTPLKPIEPKPEAVQYLEKRGISESVAKEYEITVQKDNPNILVFPFYDENGVMQFVKYRKTDFDKEKDANKEWCEAGCKPILFGMKQCKDFSRLIITEGQLDSLSVATVGVDNATSVPTGARGFTWIPYCWNWMNKFEEIIVFGDFEKGHISLLDELKNRLKNNIKHVRKEDYGECKDANEILIKHGAAQVRKCIENAVALPVKRLVPMSQVKRTDIFKIPKLKTGIAALDRLLYGGLPFGFVHIVAGKRGDGKSTLASQILANAKEQGYGVVAYSGELMNSNFMAWMDFQVAGPQNIVENRNPDGTPHWFITNSNQEKINAWYGGDCLIYDDSIVEGDEKEDLIKTVEDAICQYGIKVVLIDNLMTAMDLDVAPGTDKYEGQSRFVKRLARLARRYEALILLVAHRRKNGFTTDANDEISGSADITNLAGIVVSYDRDKDSESMFDRRLIVAKNRLFGKLNYDGYLLHFNEKSKRIYGDLDDVNKQFGWIKSEQEFIPIEKTPFD